MSAFSIDNIVDILCIFPVHRGKIIADLGDGCYTVELEGNDKIPEGTKIDTTYIYLKYICKSEEIKQ